MALQLRAKRTVLSTKFAGAFVAIAALLLQPFAGLPIASAASLSVSPTSHSTAALETDVSTSDTTGYESLSLSFSYLIDRLEPGDSLLYGWRTVGGADQQLGQLDGVAADDETTGAGAVTAISLPDTASNQVIELYFTNTGVTSGSHDIVTLSDITLSGQAIQVVEQNTVCDNGCEWTTIASAVNGEVAGSTITIKADSPKVVTSNILINKSLTIIGEAGARIQTSGSNLVFTTTGDDVTISNLTFEKTDTVSQAIINVQGENTTISNNIFNGLYTPANNTTSRALVASSGASNLSITGNSINGMRQPAYINNGASGSITDNYVNGTRGWVVEKASDFTFSGNSWNDNAVDIAIIPGSNPDTTTNNYSCRLAQIKADNNDATIEDQYPVYCPITPGATTNYPVYGTTANSENDAGKWWFNRDPSTATAYNFTGTQESIGTGSLFIPAIGTNPSDKFIGELFVANKLDETGAISFDYKLADGVAANKANQVYMNLYVNYSSTTNYGDCVYNVVATDGTAGWHTLSFVPNGTYDVRTRSSAAPNVCPAKPADLPATAYVRAMSLNLGDTSANDVGVSGYFDNVRVEKLNETAVYDFEADTAGPALTNVSPASGAFKNSDFVASVDATDQTGVKKIALYVIDTGTGAKVKEYAMQSPTSGSTWNANVKLAEIGGEGQYDLRFRAVDDLNNVTYLNNRGGSYLVNVDTTKPSGFNLKLADGRDVQGLTVGGEQTFIFTQQSEDNPQRIYIEYMEKDAGGTWRKKVGKEVLSDNRAELTVDTRSFADGLHQVKVSTRDMAGNSSGTTAQFTVDNVNPTITVKSESLGNKDQAVFRNISFKLYDKYNIDKFTIGTKTFDRTNAQYSDANFQNIKGALVQGLNTITLYDVAGNTTSYQFTYDSTPPAVNAGEDQDDIDGLSTTLSPETDVIEGMAWEMVSGPGIAEVTPIPNGSDVRVDVDTEGTYVLRLTAYDTAGNENFDDVTLTFVAPETEDDGGEETPATDTGSDTGAGTNGTPSNTASIPLATSPLAAVVTTSPTPFTTAFIGTQNNAATQSEATEQADDGDILGTTATENDDNGEVAGANDKAGWSIGDMAWYWWVVAVLGAMGLWLMIAAGIRRLRGSEV